MLFLFDRFLSIFLIPNRPLAVSAMVLAGFFVVLMWRQVSTENLLLFFYCFIFVGKFSIFFQLGSSQIFLDILDVKLVFTVSILIANIFIQPNSSNGFVLFVGICNSNFFLCWFRRLLLFCPRTRFCSCLRPCILLAVDVLASFR